MNGMRFLLATTGVTLLLATAPAHAFRCGTRIITRGDHADKLLHYCGEPAAVQTRLSQRSYVTTLGHVFVPGLVEEVVIEEWTYNLGPHKLMRVVRLENGFVADIKHLGYGY
jgi:hypothetical protein